MGDLGVNLPGLITQVISFVILFAVLYRLLHRPILRMLDERSKRISESLEAAQTARDQAARSEEAMQQQLEAARAEGQQLIAQAREVADRFRIEELAKAREEIAAERARARADIQREGDVTIEQVRREFAGLAIAAAERIIERSLDQSAHQDLIEKVLEESSQIPRG